MRRSRESHCLADRLRRRVTAGLGGSGVAAERRLPLGIVGLVRRNASRPNFPAAAEVYGNTSNPLPLGCRIGGGSPLSAQLPNANRANQAARARSSAEGRGRFSFGWHIALGSACRRRYGVVCSGELDQ